MPHTSMAVANEFLKKPDALGRLTQMQLLKLTYIAHGWNLAVNGQALIGEPVEAWNYGPVIRDLYNHLKFYGNEPITRPLSNGDSLGNRIYGIKPDKTHEYSEEFLPKEQEVIDQVWERYKNYSAYQLSMMTHRPGTPWFETYFGPGGKNRLIPNSAIRNHYVELAQEGA